MNEKKLTHPDILRAERDGGPGKPDYKGFVHIGTLIEGSPLARYITKKYEEQGGQTSDASTKKNGYTEF